MEVGFRSTLLFTVHHDAECTASCFTPDGKMLLTCGVDGALKFWDAFALTSSADRKIGQHVFTINLPMAVDKASFLRTGALAGSPATARPAATTTAAATATNVTTSRKTPNSKKARREHAHVPTFSKLYVASGNRLLVFNVCSSQQSRATSKSQSSWPAVQKTQGQHLDAKRRVAFGAAGEIFLRDLLHATPGVSAHALFSNLERYALSKEACLQLLADSPYQYRDVIIALSEQHGQRVKSLYRNSKFRAELQTDKHDRKTKAKLTTISIVHACPLLLYVQSSCWQWHRRGHVEQRERASDVVVWQRCPGNGLRRADCRRFVWLPFVAPVGGSLG